MQPSGARRPGGGEDPVYRAPNTTTRGVGFHLSYNDVDTDEAAYGSVTTALVVGNMERFYILSGDHRPGLADRVPLGLEACLEYVLAHADQLNKRSDPLPSAPAGRGA